MDAPRVPRPVFNIPMAPLHRQIPVPQPQPQPIPVPQPQLQPIPPPRPQPQPIPVPQPQPQPAPQVNEVVFTRRRIEAVLGRAVFPVVVTNLQLQATIDNVWTIFPDVDGDYLRRLCAHFHIDDVLGYLADAPPADIPRRELPRVGRDANLVNGDGDGDDDGDEEGAVAAAQPAVDKKEAYRRLRRFFAPEGDRPNNKTTFRAKPNYRRSVMSDNNKFKERLLGKLIPNLGIGTVRDAITAFDGNLSPAYAALYAIANGIKADDYGGWAPSMCLRQKLKRARTGDLTGLEDDPLFTQALKDEVSTLMRVRDGIADEEENVEKTDCPVCFDSFPITKMIACSAAQEAGDAVGEAHRFCVDCLTHQAEQAVLGEAVLAGPIGIPCMDPTCHRILIWEEVRGKLPKKLRKRLSQRFQEANIVAAGLSSIERCKECGFAVQMDVPKDIDKVFSCHKCGAQYCRLCDQKWDDAHFGRKCNELGDFALIQYREKMTAAVTRKCPRCGVVFQKNGGCNLMTCSSCAMKMCFLCREENITYDHFCPHVRDPNYPGQCPQNCKLKCLIFANSNVAIDREVNRVKEEARQNNRIANLISPNRPVAEAAPARGLVQRVVPPFLPGQR